MLPALPVILLLLLPGYSPVADAQEAADSVTVYPADYFSSLNVMTAADMVRRIPGSEAQASQRGRRDRRRGLRDQSDRLLVDGKRLVGKSNEADQFLHRLPAEKVLRIEVVDGMVTETEADAGSRTINIITNGEGAASGNWEASLHWVDGLRSATGGRLSYTRTLEKVEISMGVATSPRDYLGLQEDFEDIAGLPLEREVETRSRRSHETEFQGTARVFLSDRSTLRLNALYEEDPRTGIDHADTFEYRPDGTLLAVESSVEPSERTERTIEIGGAYEHQLNDRDRFELLFLKNDSDHDRDSRKTSVDSDGQVIERDLETRDEHSEETVLRGTWFSNREAGAEFDLGLELAVNTLDKTTVLFEGEPAPLERVLIPNADQVIREDRAELFANYAFNWAKTRVRLGLAAEFSEFDQQGTDVSQSRSLDYLKPSINLSHGRADGSRLFLTLRRDVSQLRFDDFVAYIDPWDDEIRAGNPDLLPETSWDLELGSEHHFGDNAGLLKLSLFHRWVEDVRDLAPLEPDDSQPGNLPDSRHWGVQADFGLRLDRLGMSGAVVNGSFKWQDSRTTDPFTGETRRIQGQKRYEAELEFRHDLERLRGAYGMAWESEGREYRFDVDRSDVERDSGSMRVFIERRIGNSKKLRLSARNLHEPHSRRTRINYDPDRAAGIPGTREIRTSTWSRSVTLTLSGTF